MRQAYAHDAVVELDDGDLRALGGAITIALCGDLDHEPPCPLAPHHTAARRTNQAAHVQVRVLFATEPANLPEVRSRIDSALEAGQFTDSRGSSTTWTCCAARPGVVTAEDAGHARRLIAS